VLRVALVWFATAMWASAGSITADSISMTGNGNWNYSYPGDGTYSVWASGSNGTDSASLSYNGDWGCITYSISMLYGGTEGGFENNGSGFATIDNISSSYFQFLFSGEDSYLTLFDSNRDVIATADLTAYLNVTSSTVQYVGNTVVESYGTFAVLSTPEPAGIGLVAVGLLAVWSLRRAFPNFR
jgi:hypothetical protein